MKNSAQLPKTILQVITQTLPTTGHSIALHEPLFSGSEWEYMQDCLDSGWVSSVGTYVDRFQQMLCDFTSSPYAVAVVNGTAALHICMLVAGIRTGDEVLMPALTFVATANAITYCGAIPHLIDIEESSLGVDPAKLADYLGQIAGLKDGHCFNRLTGRYIKAIVPVHVFGHPVDMDPLLELCERYRLIMIEDAAEALGSQYKGQHVGTRGQLATLSFNGNKIITTGGGGAILTKHTSMSKLAKHLTTQARAMLWRGYNHDMIGYNYRLPNINAALGCAQLEQLPHFVSWKRNLASRYREAFQAVAGVAFFAEKDFARSNYWLNTLFLDPEFTGLRDKVIELTNRSGIQTRPAWKLMHQLPMYHACPGMDLSVAEDMEKRIINIPSSPILGKTIHS